MKLFRKTIIQFDSFLAESNTLINLPLFSKILNFTFNKNNSTITILSEYFSDNIIDSKVFNIKILNNANEYINIAYGYEYHSTFNKKTVNLNSVSNNNIYYSTNIELRAETDDVFFDIFIQEMKPICELREDKLKNII